MSEPSDVYMVLRGIQALALDRIVYDGSQNCENLQGILSVISRAGVVPVGPEKALAEMYRVLHRASEVDTVENRK